MRPWAQVAAGVVAGLAASGAVFSADATQSTTVLGPTNPQLAEGAAALVEGRTEDGIRLTLEGLKLPTDPRNKAAGYANLCAGYAMLRMWDEALQHCNTAIELDRNNWRSFNNRAAVHAGKGEYDLAVDDIRAGLDIAPDSRTLTESLRIIQQNKRLVGTRSRSSVRPP